MASLGRLTGFGNSAEGVSRASEVANGPRITTRTRRLESRATGRQAAGSARSPRPVRHAADSTGRCSECSGRGGAERKHPAAVTCRWCQRTGRTSRRRGRRTRAPRPPSARRRCDARLPLRQWRSALGRNHDRRQRRPGARAGGGNLALARNPSVACHRLGQAMRLTVSTRVRNSPREAKTGRFASVLARLRLRRRIH